MFCLINRERVGLSPLQPQAELNQIAQAYSEQMSEQHFFSHVSPAGITLHGRASSYTNGWSNFELGENIASTHEPSDSPAKIFSLWMNSAPHRNNILSPLYNQGGLGISLLSVQGTPGSTWTLDFGSRSNSTHLNGQTDGTFTSPDPPAQREPSASPVVKPSKSKAAAKRARTRSLCRKLARANSKTRKGYKKRYNRCLRSQS